MMSIYIWIFMRCKSIEHGPDFVVEGLIIKVINFDGLEVFLRIEVSLSDKECLPEH